MMIVERNKFLCWTPRVLSIIFVLFLAMFSLDVFEGNYGFWGTIVGLFMHNIPSLVLLVVLIISWKHELVGGVVFNLAGLLYIGLVLAKPQSNPQSERIWLLNSLIIAGPAFITGILWILSWRDKRRNTKT